MLLHPGTNSLGRYFPKGKINDLLLPWTPRVTKVSSASGAWDFQDQEEIEMEDHIPSETDVDTEEVPVSTAGEDGAQVITPMELDDDPSIAEDVPEASDIIDLASFLEFAVATTHCLETLHKAGLIHREVRANAFHINFHSGLVRFAHFGNRSVSLERLGGPSALVISADSMPLSEQRKVKEAMCYLAPEQTGTAETINEDHRTDLYALGVLFWTLLVGNGHLPFEGTPMELLHAVVQKSPVPVHEIRRDIPVVVSQILEKVSVTVFLITHC